MILLEGSTVSEPEKEGRSESPVYQHNRTVIVVAPTVVILVDDLEAPVPCDWKSSLHLHPDVGARQASDRIVLTAPGLDGPNLFFAASEGNPQARIDNDWVAPVYNRKVRSKTIRATAYDVRRTQLVTVVLLSPLEKRVSDCRCDIRFGRGEGNPRLSAAIIDIREGSSRHVLGIPPPGGACDNQEISTDGRVASLLYKGGILREVGLLGGTSVRAGGREIMAHSSVGDYFELF